MTSVVQFVPKSELEAIEQVKAFIEHARNTYMGVMGAGRQLGKQYRRISDCSRARVEAYPQVRANAERARENLLRVGRFDFLNIE